jgi:hypothetical protein
MVKYDLDGKYPQKSQREPITHTGILNLDNPEFAKPLFCNITNIEMGKNEYGNYVTFILVHEKFGETFIRKTVNIDYKDGKYGKYLSRECKILTEMFKIDDSEKWVEMNNETIAVILKRKTDKTKKEVRNDTGNVLIGCTIISPDELKDNPELMDAYVPDDETETPTEPPKKEKQNPLDYTCGTCNEKYLLDKEPLAIVDGKRKCANCIKKDYELKQAKKKQICDKCKHEVKDGMMKQHLQTNCKMFVVKG